jgi:2-keto-4-pentenoate hydratase/2-oxohepta-3-ene-1,7-dioic acid hydratase in catechol pathway
MRLVTYDRGGVRRLGALVAEPPTVIDLGDAVGHPAFPSTLEGLVERSGGTMLDAAHDAASREDNVEEFGVGDPPLLAPFSPPGSRTPVLGASEEPPWPPFQSYLDHSPEIGVLLGREGHDLTVKQARAAVFGYVLVVRWLRATGRRTTVALSLGPWVATPEEVDLRQGGLRSTVGGVVCATAPLDPARWVFPDLIAERSRRPAGVRPGLLVTSSLGRSTTGLGIPLEPGSSVEVEADGLGAVRTTLMDVVDEPAEPRAM